MRTDKNRIPKIEAQFCKLRIATSSAHCAQHTAHHSTEEQQRVVTNDVHAAPFVSGRRWDVTRSNAHGDRRVKWSAGVCKHREALAVLAYACPARLATGSSLARESG